MKYKMIFILLTVALLCGAGYRTLYNKDTKTPRWREVEITLGDVREEVTAQGKLEPKEYVDVGTQVSGQIKKFYVNIGDDVKQGDMLVEIDPRLYESRVASGEASIRTLNAQVMQEEANLMLARSQYTRNKKLSASGAVSKDALEQSEATLKSGEAKIAALKAQIAQAQSTLDGDKTNLTYTKIMAPMSGTVVAMPLREGQTVNASQTAPTLLTISNLDTMTVRAQVAEADVMRLKNGMEVSFTTMGQMDRRWKATVRQILPTPQNVSDVVLYDVLIDSANPDRALMTGMSTQVFFTVGEAKGVPLIPVEALSRRSEDGSYKIKVPKDERTIHIGLMDRSMAEVKDGLSAGEKILLPPTAAQPANKNAPRFRGGPML